MTTYSGRIDPVAGPLPPPGLARSVWKLRHRLRGLLGIRRSFKVDGVYFKETSPELLWRALSRKGSGQKEFRVTFPDRSKMLIHCTSDRAYADVVGPLHLCQYQRTASMIRPGMRVLDLYCGTGYGAAWLSRQVGPSGAVVAIDPEPESIAFAQKRYGESLGGLGSEGADTRDPGAAVAPRATNIAFEVGDVAALRGETDGSFDAAFSIASLQLVPNDAALLAEAWRVVAPGGWLQVVAPAGASAPPGGDPVRGPAPARRYDGASLLALLSDPRVLGTASEGARPELLSTPDDGMQVAIVRKPAG